MNTFLKTSIATVISLMAMLFVPTAAFASGVPLTATPTATATPTLTTTPTPTPKVETRIDCSTESYGKQSCKTVSVEKPAAPVHQVVNSGVGENLVMAFALLFVISTLGYTYSKVNN